MRILRNALRDAVSFGGIIGVRIGTLLVAVMIVSVFVTVGGRGNYHRFMIPGL
jgi:hypothetical protein